MTQISKIYGYCRISRKSQNIQRQLENILDQYPKAILKQEIFTGTTIERKEWVKLKQILKSGDTIIFDSVSRMSRNSEDGIIDYMELMESGINLVFLKEPYINTDVYKKAITIQLSKTGNEIVDIYISKPLRKF